MEWEEVVMDNTGQEPEGKVSPLQEMSNEPHIRTEPILVEGSDLDLSSSDDDDYLLLAAHLSGQRQPHPSQTSVTPIRASTADQRTAEPSRDKPQTPPLYPLQNPDPSGRRDPTSHDMNQEENFSQWQDPWFTPQPSIAPEPSGPLPNRNPRNLRAATCEREHLETAAQPIASDSDPAAVSSKSTTGPTDNLPTTEMTTSPPLCTRQAAPRGSSALQTEDRQPHTPSAADNSTLNLSQVAASCDNLQSAEWRGCKVSQYWSCDTSQKNK
nr:PREDICTED: uncharacterized protein LOC106706717 [Latimeria chalumnae]|eukprot:XP_014353528.1 PREDICTED: uncharacterized protein LOC106706717 [Latimeria chalumnae]